MISVLFLFESLLVCSGECMAGLNTRAGAGLEKLAVAIGVESAEPVVEIKLVVVGIVLLTEAVVSGPGTGEVAAGIAVAEVVEVVAAGLIVVDRTACSVERDFGIVAVVLLLAFAELAVTAAELTRTDYILVGFDTVVVDAGVVGATVADTVAAGKDIAVDVAAVVVAAVADAVADSGS